MDLAIRLGPYFEAQLRLARRMAELTGSDVGEAVFRHTNLCRRLGLGIPLKAPPTEIWRAYARGIEATRDLPEQIALTQQTFAAHPEEAAPPFGQVLFGCFAHELPDADGRVKIHFYNRDTDEAGGPLASGKAGRRKDELAAMVRHIRQTHPEATAVCGGSWLYNLEAYRRLFPPDYAASRNLPATVRMTGTSTWGQLIDSRNDIRPDVRDAMVANLDRLDPGAPWLAFPFRALSTWAPLERFEAFYGL